MKNIKQLVMGRGVFALGAIWLAVITTMYALPASLWLIVDSVFVQDSVSGHPVVMQVEREIVRPFRGTYDVALRKVSSDKIYIACSSSGTVDYAVGSELPETVTLGWWTGGRCEHLEPGVYSVQTVWTIHASGLKPDKTVSVKSNYFTVH